MSGQIKNVSGVPASLKLENMFFSKIEYFREEDFQKTLEFFDRMAEKY